MAAAKRKNAIEKRLDLLEGQWNEFAEDPEPRLLRWLAKNDEAQVVLGFIEQQRAGCGEVPDLFIRLESPFEEPLQHGFALRDEFLKLYAEMTEDEDFRKELAADGIDVEWKCPDSAPGGSDIAAFTQCCASFRQYYDGGMLNLAVALTPPGMANGPEWAQWLLAFVRSGLPANVRFLVLDTAEAPVLDDLAKAEPKLVRTIEPELNMEAAPKELLREAGGTGPGVAFRRHFFEITEAAGKGNLAKVEQLVPTALAIASEHNWLDQQVVIHMAMGAAYLGAGKCAEALATYRKAGQAAADTAMQGHPAGQKLVLQALLSEGAALLSDKQHGEAAKVYEKAAAEATAQKDHLMTLESWRMAAFCHEMAAERDAAWECGCKALDAGELLEDKLRSNSTLPYAGQGLLRLLERPKKQPQEKRGWIQRFLEHDEKEEEDPYEERRQFIMDRMGKLIGPNWQKKLEATGSPGP